MAMEQHLTQDSAKLFEEIDTYPWDTDAEFQGGLAAILGPKPTASQEQTQELTLRARLFYYARKKNISPINFDAYKAYLTAKASAATDENPPYPTPFAEIVALITSGKPIPGIRDIPPTVLSNRATQPIASKRRKPWEKDEDLAVGERTFGDRRDEATAEEEPEDEHTG